MIVCSKKGFFKRVGKFQWLRYCYKYYEWQWNKITAVLDHFNCTPFLKKLKDFIFELKKNKNMTNLNFNKQNVVKTTKSNT